MVQLLKKGNKIFLKKHGKIYKKSFYNIVETKDDYCSIFNSSSGAVAIVKKSEYEGNQFSKEDWNILIENGFYVEQNKNEFLAYLSTISFAYEKDPNFFTIIPTTACNAKCFYCYEKEYKVDSIDSKSHNIIVDYIVSHIKNKNFFVLDWYGGEPLLMKKEIDNIIQEIGEKINLDRYDWYSSITSNATLFTDSLVECAVKDWNLKIAYITLDGTRNEHNRRKNVYPNIPDAYEATCKAVRNLLNKGVFVNLRIHLDGDNKNCFPQLLDDISDFFSYDNFQLFPTFLFPPEFDMPMNYVRDNNKEELFYYVFSQMKLKGVLNNYVSYFPKPKLKNCFATEKNKVVISTDGSVYSCVQEFSKGDEEKETKFLDYKEDCVICKECPFFPICLSGCIHNRWLKNSVRTPCVRNRYIIRPLLQLILEEKY